MIMLSASTLGAPGTSLHQVLRWLREAGVPGVELRLSSAEIADPALSRSQRQDLRAEIDDAGIVITGIASYVKVAAPTEDNVVVGALVGALDFAADLGAPAVRVFSGAPVEPGSYLQRPRLLESAEEVEARAARRLNAVAGFADESGVLPVLETHDSHPTGTDIARILARVNGPVGAVWDLMHPWRVGEELSATWDALAPWLAAGRGSVQVKDANLPESATPLLVGDGTLPTAQFGELLVSHGYSGSVTLEWEKAWHPEAVPLNEALESAKRWFARYWPDGTV